jgi:hypothetical protein
MFAIDLMGRSHRVGRRGLYKILKDRISSTNCIDSWTIKQDADLPSAFIELPSAFTIRITLKCSPPKLVLTSSASHVIASLVLLNPDFTAGTLLGFSILNEFKS